MPSGCCVFGCSANAKRNRGLTFHQFPKDDKLKEVWKLKIRQGKTITPHMKVCSLHFTESDFTTPSRNDGITRNRFLEHNAYPTRNLPAPYFTEKGRRRGRSARVASRNKLIPVVMKRKIVLKNEDTTKSNTSSVKKEFALDVKKKKIEVKNKDTSKSNIIPVKEEFAPVIMKKIEFEKESKNEDTTKTSISPVKEEFVLVVKKKIEFKKEIENEDTTKTNISPVTETVTPDVKTFEVNKEVENEDTTEAKISPGLSIIKPRCSLLKKRENNPVSIINFINPTSPPTAVQIPKLLYSHHVKKRKSLFSVSFMTEKQLVHFTGFNHNQFQWFWKFIVSRPVFKKCQQCEISTHDQLLLTLIKMRLNMSFQTLAISFSVSDNLISIIFSHWVTQMYMSFKEVDFWDVYHKSEKEYDIIIDCTEISIQNSSELVYNQAIFSKYESEHTLKALVGVSESGAALYCSPLYGGSTSDRQVVVSSGFLNLVKQGYHIMADDSFLIADLLEKKGATLNIPPGRQKRTIPGLNLDMTRPVSNRAILEQTIGKAKCYAILTDTVPTYMIPLMDQIFYSIFHFINFKTKSFHLCLSAE